MKLNYNQFLAVVYGEIFEWPLTEAEARVWAINYKGNEIKDKRLKIKERKMDQRVWKKGVLHRRRREKISQGKEQKARQVTAMLKKIPTLLGVFLTGSVAVGNAKKDADVDLMIITAPGTLWFTRLIVILLLKQKGIYRNSGINGNYRDKICPNIFLDSNNLEIKEKNLYTAHEILQARCLFDRGNMEKLWLRKNKWAHKHLSYAYAFKTEQESKFQGQFPISNKPISNLRVWNLEIGARWSWLLGILIIFEPFFFLTQYLFMKPKMTNERVGWGYAFFHPQRLGRVVEEKFRQRLLKYTGQ